MFKKAWIMGLILAVSLTMSVPALAQEPAQTQETQELTAESVLKVLPEGSVDLSDSDATLSRGAFAAMLAYAAGISSNGDLDRSKLPPDFKPDAWYAGQVAALCENNILKGLPDKKIYPENPITGIEAMALIARTLGIPESSPAPDIKVDGIQEGHWGYVLYSWLQKEGLALENIDPAKPINPDTAAKLLVNVFGTDREAKAIVDEANARNKDLDSMRAKGTMAMKMNMVAPDGSLMPVNTNMTFNTEISKDMVIHQTLETAMPDMNNADAAQTVTIEEYIDKDYIYMLVAGQDGQKNWTKMKNPVPMVFDKQFISQQQEMMNGFEGMVHYRLMGKETLDGKEVYKMAMYSRIDDILKLFDMLGSVGEQEKQALGAANSILKSIYMSGIIYMGVEDGLVYKADMTATILMDTEKQEGSPVAISSMDMEMSYDYYDYNADISINIPDEAKNAEELDLNNLPSTQEEQ